MLWTGSLTGSTGHANLMLEGKLIAPFFYVMANG
jgi:hypothetical protein